MTDERPTNRWRGVIAVTLLTGAVGTIAQRPTIVLLAVLGIVYAAYPRVTAPPDPTLALERTLDDPEPGDGDHVTVETTVRNLGEDVLIDVRIVDGVPTALSVVEGSPRRGAVLRPGTETTFEYVVEARAGRHPFEPATVVARDIAGAHEVETTTGVETEITCSADLDSPPVRSQTLDVVGRVRSSGIGHGIEFDRTREYERGDELGRIDWKRFARTGELTTIEFRVERSVSVVPLVDATPSAYRGAGDGHNAVAACVSAAEDIARTFVADRNRAGFAAFGREFIWVPPGGGRELLVSIRQTVGHSETFLPTAPETCPPLDQQLRSLRGRLPDASQVILLSPLCDDQIVDVTVQLERSGHAVTVLTPDVTATETLGQRFATVERRERLSRLRGIGIQVVEWPLDTALSATLATAPGVERA